ncbi:AAA domain protein [Rhodococcus sp. MTM3W5.2]|uniref:helix-turn-helix transcriptional regulator n=1 Tax=Rhodococcus sp. MTM3W5.2 TaxID=1805827 RepID=UPI0009797F56|nr:LuxR family transcriptional regulator [Rhodococcus sp. MTM3W5.2]AQA26055.1 AAA domain protein [Rhodococcus sp. MTM3W5.2]
MQLDERAGEMKALEDVFGEISGSEGRVVIVTGASGAGKTSVVQAFGARLPADVCFWSAVGARAERDLPLGILAQLLQQQAVDCEVESLYYSALAILRDAEMGTGEVLAGPMHRLGVAIADIARKVKLVIAIDDVHYADEASLQVLSYVLRRLGSIPVLIVVTRPFGPSISPSASYAEFSRCPGIRHLRLGLLGISDIYHMLVGIVGEQSAGPLSADCLELTGGNPRLVRAFAEQCRWWAESGDLSLDDWNIRRICGLDLGQAALACLHSMDETAVQLGTSLAILGDEATIGRLVRLTGIGVCVVNDVVSSLSAAGLVASGRFRNPLLGEAIVECLPVAEKIQLHRNVARLCFDEGREPLEVARYLVAAGSATEPWAGQVLRDAAIEAVRIEDRQLAMECLQLAETRCANESDRAAVDFVRVTVDSSFDPALAARGLDRLVGSNAAGHLDRVDALLLIRHLVWHGRLDEARSCLETLGNRLDPRNQQDTGELHFVRSWLSYICPPLAATALEEWVDPSQSVSGDRFTGRRRHAIGLLREVMAAGGNPETIAMLEELLTGRLWENESVGEPASALLALVYAGRPDIAIHWCDRLLKPATQPIRSSSLAASLNYAKAAAAEHQGDLLLAEDCATTALHQISTSGWGIALGAPLSIIISACTATGKTDAAAKWLNFPVPESMFNTPFGLNYLHARGEYLLATARPAAALEDFTACGDLIVKWGIDSPAYLPWRTSAAMACIALGDHDRARVLADEQCKRPGADTPRARAVSLRVSAAARPTRERPSLLQEALAVLSTTTETAESVRVLAELSMAFRDLSVSSRARSTARKAWALASSAGLEDLCTKRLSTDLMAHLHATEGTDSAPSELVVLTDSETAVARLAALEYTNREISRKMNITVSTVEQHLTRVYRKLGLSGRKEIGIVMRTYVAGRA